jgi:GTPase SAR1 family protein
LDSRLLPDLQQQNSKGWYDNKSKRSLSSTMMLIRSLMSCIELEKELDSGSVKRRQAKVLLVGDAMAGKTTCLRALMNKTFEQTLERTNGISINTIKIACADETCEQAVAQTEGSCVIQRFVSGIAESVYHYIHSATSKSLRSLRSRQAVNPIEQVTFQIWDFAGQEVYQTTHQVFVTESTHATHTILRPTS